MTVILKRIQRTMKKNLLLLKDLSDYRQQRARKLRVKTTVFTKKDTTKVCMSKERMTKGR